MAASLKLSELTALERNSPDILTGEIASGDYLLIADVSESASKKATLNEVSVCLKDTDRVCSCCESLLLDEHHRYVVEGQGSGVD